MPKRTKEELNIIRMCNNYLLDGIVGKELTTSGNSTVWMQIKNGIPRMFKQGPGSKYFDGKENVHVEGKLHILKEWLSDDDRLLFFQKFGFLINNDIVKGYSAKYKPSK